MVKYGKMMLFSSYDHFIIFIVGNQKKYEHEEITQMIGNHMPSGNYRRIYLHFTDQFTPQGGNDVSIRMEKTY